MLNGALTESSGEASNSVNVISYIGIGGVKEFLVPNSIINNSETDYRNAKESRTLYRKF